MESSGYADCRQRSGGEPKSRYRDNLPTVGVGLFCFCSLMLIYKACTDGDKKPQCTGFTYWQCSIRERTEDIQDPTCSPWCGQHRAEAPSGCAWSMNRSRCETCESVQTREDCVDGSECTWKASRQQCEMATGWSKLGNMIVFLIFYPYLIMAGFSFLEICYSELPHVCGRAGEAFLTVRLLPRLSTITASYESLKKHWQSFCGGRGLKGPLLHGEVTFHEAAEPLEDDAAFLGEAMLDIIFTVCSVVFALFAAATTEFSKVPTWAMFILPVLAMRAALRQAEMSGSTVTDLFLKAPVNFSVGLLASFDGPSHVLAAINMACKTSPWILQRLSAWNALDDVGSESHSGQWLFTAYSLILLFCSMPMNLAAAASDSLAAARIVGLDTGYSLRDDRKTLSAETAFDKFLGQQLTEVLPTLAIQRTFLVAQGCGLGHDPVGSVTFMVTLLMSVKCAVQNASQLPGFTFFSLCFTAYIFFKLLGLESCDSGVLLHDFSCAPSCYSVWSTTPSLGNITCVPAPVGC